MRRIRVKPRMIVSIIFLLILPLLLFFYLFCRPIPAIESPWKVEVGKNKVTRFEPLSWFDQGARYYTTSQKPDEVIFAPSSPFYVFPWSPKRKREGRYVWSFNPSTVSLKPILYDNFLALNPKLPGELPKRIQDFLQQQLDYEIAQNAPSPEMVMEVIRFKSNDQEYEAKLAVSNFKSVKRRRFGTEFAKNEPRGWHTGVYYSGTLHFDVFALSERQQPIVALEKEFKDWDYPVRRNPNQVIQPSYIGTFGNLYFLPDSRPSFMVLSKVYQAIYQIRRDIGDDAFSLIIL